MVERAGVTGAGLATGGGDETGAEVVAGGLVEAEALGGRPRGRVLWQFPESPGRQREQIQNFELRMRSFTRIARGNFRTLPVFYL